MLDHCGMATAASGTARIQWCLAGAVITGALMLTSCARPNQPASAASPPLSPASAARTGGAPPTMQSCPFLDPQQLHQITRIPVQRTLRPDPSICIFDLTTAATPEDISLLWMKGTELCPSCAAVPGLGDQAGWSDSSRQLDVVLGDHLMVLYVHLSDEHLYGSTRQERAIQVYRAAEPQLH
jgi:hypothetical protein